MSQTRTRKATIRRRGELLAELFLQDLNPAFVARAAVEEFAYDFLVGFRNAKGGINNIAVEVKTTERPPEEGFTLPRVQHERLANSNLPVLLLVIDVKANRYYFAWVSPRLVGRAEPSESIGMTLTEFNESSKAELLDRVSS